MSRQVVKLRRIWGTSDQDCRVFLHDLYRELVRWTRNRASASVDVVLSPNEPEVVVDAASMTEAWAVVTLAAQRADPTWKRLYQLTG
jgi:hypothetical protein